jgi:osmoprotectant transport system permease protein
MNRLRFPAVFALLCVGALLCASAYKASALKVVVGSKKFVESYILAEIAKRQLEKTGTIAVDHQMGLGATGIVWNKLKSGEISLYPDYTATIAEEILKLPAGYDEQTIVEGLKREGIGMTASLGFNDNYALVMKRTRAQELGIRKISDLAQHPELRVGPTAEFNTRKDGFKALCATYGLNFSNVATLEHSIGYAKINTGQIDLMECYTTDPEIAEFDLVVLEDDRKFFPVYKAVFLYRLDLPQDAVAALKQLEGRFSQEQMIRLNSEGRKSGNYALVAASFFGSAAQTHAAGRCGICSWWGCRFYWQRQSAFRLAFGHHAAMR